MFVSVNWAIHQELPGEQNQRRKVLRNEDREGWCELRQAEYAEIPGPFLPKERCLEESSAPTACYSEPPWATPNGAEYKVPPG